MNLKEIAPELKSELEKSPINLKHGLASKFGRVNLSFILNVVLKSHELSIDSLLASVFD